MGELFPDIAANLDLPADPCIITIDDSGSESVRPEENEFVPLTLVFELVSKWPPAATGNKSWLA